MGEMYGNALSHDRRRSPLASNGVDQFIQKSQRPFLGGRGKGGPNVRSIGWVGGFCTVLAEQKNNCYTGSTESNNWWESEGRRGERRWLHGSISRSQGFSIYSK